MTIDSPRTTRASPPTRRSSSPGNSSWRFGSKRTGEPWSLNVISRAGPASLSPNVTSGSHGCRSVVLHHAELLLPLLLQSQQLEAVLQGDPLQTARLRDRALHEAGQLPDDVGEQALALVLGQAQKRVPGLVGD